MRALRVLIVDDDEMVLRAVRRPLESTHRGWMVEAFSNAVGGLQQVRGGDFDVVVTDLEMGAVNGFDLLEASAHTRPEALRILMTGSGGNLEKALAHFVVRKPEIMAIREAVLRHAARLGL